MTSATNENGVTVSNSTSTATNYSLPDVITPGGNGNLATSLTYNGSWAVTSVTGANGANATTTYDGFGRPATSKIPDGATTTYTYAYNPNTQTATLNGRWTKTTLDGFGRPVKVETGNGGTTVSVAETEYAPCGCSPLGKVWRTARPHAPGGAQQWTTYSYDGMGRTVAVTLPDGSVTRTEYWSNSVKTIDAAGKWKKHTTDALGNLRVVTEPNPAGGADWTTTYTYSALNRLTRVEMPRPYNGGTYTQVRTFTWNGDKLASETNPETGTIQYQYDANRRLTARIDARNRKQEYSYDAYGRMTQKRFYNPTYPFPPYATWVEDEGLRVDYRYDTNPLDAAFTQNGQGRLTAVEFHNSDIQSPQIAAFSYQYSYNQAGRTTNQRMRITSRFGGTPINLDAVYAWDNEGRMTSQQGPDNAPVETFAYDAMGRLSSGGATYGPAGELLTFNGVTRTYNVLGQLTRMTKSGVMDMEYRYTAGQNNGRIWQSKDYVTGEEVTYQYDALNRLGRAETTDSAWGNAYAYDGWGNLTGKSVTKGVAPTLSASYDPSLNLTVGSTPPNYWVETWPQTHDGEDRGLTGQSALWQNTLGQMVAGRVSYDPAGKKVFWYGQVYNDQVYEGMEDFPGCEVYFHGITGQRLARLKCAEVHGTVELQWTERTQHIGGQLTVWNGGAATTDRLGSLRARGTERYTYYPYGEPRTATVTGGGVYAGLESPLRNYVPATGRFDRPDPLGLGAVKLGDPGSWNRFAYVQGDPVNFKDPRGLKTICVERENAPPSCVDETIGGGGVGGEGGGDPCEPPRAMAFGAALPMAPCGGPPEEGGVYDARADFRDYAVRLSNDPTKSDCEELALMAYKAGQVTSGAGAIIEMLQTGLTERSGRLGTSDPNYRVGVLRSDPYYAKSFGDAGFLAGFQDSSNQVRHFVGWLAAGYLVPTSVATSVLYRAEGTNDPKNADVALGLSAIQLGASFRGDATQLAQDIWHQICGQTSNLNFK